MPMKRLRFKNRSTIIYGDIRWRLSWMSSAFVECSQIGLPDGNWRLPIRRDAG